MINVSIRNHAGKDLVATAQSDDAIGSEELRVYNINLANPANQIQLHSEYQVSNDDGSNLIGRTCIALNGDTATFIR